MKKPLLFAHRGFSKTGRMMDIGGEQHEGTDTGRPADAGLY